MFGLKPRFEKTVHAALHPGRSAAILIAGKRIGVVGELHPQWQQKYDLPMAPIIFELAVSALKDVKPPWYRPISRMQIVRRDIAVLVDDTVEMQALVDAVADAKIASITDFSPFDLYRGESLGPGKKSVAFRILMQDTDRTLVDSEADNKVSEILKVLSEEFGATLRK